MRDINRDINKVIIFTALLLVFTFHQEISAQDNEKIEKTLITDITSDEITKSINIVTSKVWNSKGKTISNFDVSQSKKIAIAFMNNTVGVFDEHMNFLYEISFESSGAYGVLWEGNRVMLYCLRENRAIAFDEAGEMAATYCVTNGGRNWGDTIGQLLRIQGEDTYSCTYHRGLIPVGGYTILGKIDGDGNIKVLYEAENKLFGSIFFILFVLCAIMFMGLFILLSARYGIKRLDVLDKYRGNINYKIGSAMYFQTMIGLEECIRRIQVRNAYDTLNYSLIGFINGEAQIEVWSKNEIKKKLRLIYKISLSIWGNMTIIKVKAAESGSGFRGDYDEEMWEFISEKFDARACIKNER